MLTGWQTPSLSIWQFGVPGQAFGQGTLTMEPDTQTPWHRPSSVHEPGHPVGEVQMPHCSLGATRGLAAARVTAGGKNERKEAGGVHREGFSSAGNCLKTNLAAHYIPFRTDGLQGRRGNFSPNQLNGTAPRCQRLVSAIGRICGAMDIANEKQAAPRGRRSGNTHQISSRLGAPEDPKIAAKCRPSRNAVGRSRHSGE
ncbi:hypothetical protein B0H14DRAFT_2624887 [Mycena olivaceomarginata]|nr:hypothetical protein B0H14DRAFT_2624887 [Mycena olivaceomarginata]